MTPAQAMQHPQAIPVSGVPGAGILWAFHFGSTGQAEPLATSDVDAAMAVRQDGWFWIHLSLADMRCRNWIESHPALSAIARETLIGPDEHQRLDLYGRDIVGVMPDLYLEFGHSGEELSRLRFLVGERLLLTIRRKPLRSIELARQSVEAGSAFAAPVELLDHIVDRFGDLVGQIVERLGQSLDEAEAVIWQEAFADESKRIAKARNAAAPVHRQLAQMRALFHRIEPRLANAWPDMAAPVGALAQKLDSLDHSVAAVHERARLLQEEMATKMTAITNRRLFTLSVLTAGLLPATLVTGFFGMNTRDLPFQNTEGGTWYALAIAFVASAAIYGLLKRMNAL